MKTTTFTSILCSILATACSSKESDKDAPGNSDLTGVQELPSKSIIVDSSGARIHVDDAERETIEHGDIPPHFLKVMEESHPSQNTTKQPHSRE